MTRRPKYIDYVASIEAAWDLLEPLYNAKNAAWRELNYDEFMDIGRRLNALSEKITNALMANAGINPDEFSDSVDAFVAHVAPRSRRSQ
jgi:hypothetical protein